MKKIKYLVFLLLTFLLFGTNVSANTIESINVDIKIDDNAVMHVTEIWQMITNKDTEIYKEEYGLGNMAITNFKVKDETREYALNSDWDIHESFENKKYTYGINEVSEGIELCWGISEYGNKVYTISYDVSNAVFNTEDAQVLYMKLINELDFPPEEFEVVISGTKPFEDTLDVWGYGYYGRAYVSEGKIYMSSKRALTGDEYGVLLVKFPMNYFDNIQNNYSQYDTFNDVLNSAEKGSFKQDYASETNSIWNIIESLLPFLIFIIPTIFIMIKKMKPKYKFGTAGKDINLKEINAFRDIPCKKDIYRAFFVAEAYNLNDKKEDFFGSVFLSWLCYDKITFTKYTKKTLFGKKEKEGLLLKDQDTFLNDVEKKFYEMAKDASEDNVIEENEFKKWSKVNYTKILNWFEEAEIYGRDCYKADNLVKYEKRSYVIDDKLKNDAIELAGLKKYLKEFAYMNEKQPMEVKLWKEYLIYAQIFGMADKVAKSFEKFYPEILEQIKATGFDMTDIIFMTHMSTDVVKAASAAKDAAAAAYSGGGGGFSSGGGGGGSFGGGGGGSR